MKAYSSAVDRALAIAAVAHGAQKRKGSDVPYIIHPMHVALILLRYEFPENAVLAGVLHDVVEDTSVTLEQIGTDFGPMVAHLVDQVSEQKRVGPDGEKLPWRDRKQEQIARLQHADPAAAAVKAADALHNCQSMLRDLSEHGAALWQRFRGSQSDQLWYYTSLAGLLRQRLGGHPICDELDEAVAQLAVWHCKNCGETESQS